MTLSTFVAEFTLPITFRRATPASPVTATYYAETEIITPELIRDITTNLNRNFASTRGNKIIPVKVLSIRRAPDSE